MRKVITKVIGATKHILVKVFIIVGITIAISGSVKKTSTAAEAGLTVKAIDYYHSTMTLQVNNQDKVIYFTDSTKKKWETVPGEINSDATITLDISWIPMTRDYVINFKGDYSTAILSVTIPKQVTNFKASFSTLKGLVSFTNAENRGIEWRKKGSTSWNTLDLGTVATDLSNYYTNGVQLIYRLSPVNGTSAGIPGARASNEVSVNIPKKIAAPSISINGSKFSIPVKKGISYRKENSDGTYTGWTDMTSTTELLISNVAPEVLYNGNTGNQKKVTMQFRTSATSTSQISNITTLDIPIQKVAPVTDLNGITLNYTSATTLSLIVKSASSINPYEYTIILKDKALNYQTAIWKTISSGSLVSINSTTAPAGSHIYIRLKSIVATDTVDFALASVETDITGSGGVKYPSAAQVNQLTTLVSTAGVCQTGNSSSYLIFYLYSPTSTTVSAIDLYDAYGNSKGTVTCKSTVSANSKSTSVDDKYIITTSITSTTAVDAITEEALYAYITLANQEVIKSTANAGISLYLYPCTVINNPSETGYTADFKRIYKSSDNNDASSFQFCLDFGMEKVIDPSGINKFSAESTAISTMKYNGYLLVKGVDYTVEYGSYMNDDKLVVATAKVTVNVASMEKSTTITTLNQALPLVITLNNNEVLDNDVAITMIRTAVLDNTPIAWSITEGSLPEKTPSTVTNTDGSTTTTTKEVITYTITLTLFSDSYEVSVANVTWGDYSVFGSATITKGKATIYLSNAKINKLVTNSTDTKNIVITLSNGYVIESGCKLTILNAN